MLFSFGGAEVGLFMMNILVLLAIGVFYIVAVTLFVRLLKFFPPLVIGVMGSGHLLHGHGVPRQLKDLGIERVETLLPWTPNQQCKDLTTGAATAVFGIPEPRPAAARPLLGISLETTADGLRVASVGRNSIAETAGVKEGDILVEVAGAKPSTAADVRAVVEAMAPGTWLPLKAKRGSDTIDLVARFPVRP